MRRRSGPSNPRLPLEAFLFLALLAVIASALLAAAIVKTAGAGSGPFNVLDYGATGDGRTDDAAAIQRAVDAAAAVGGSVVIPSGTFAVGSTISLPSGVTLEGQAATLFMASQSAATPLLAVVDVGHVTIRDLTIGSDDASGKVIAIRLARHTGCVVQNVDVVNCYYGLKIDTGGADLTVSDFTASATGQPVYVSNLDGGSFENLSLDAVEPQLESYTFHALYVERNNRNLTFRSTRLTGGSGFTLQLCSDAGWSSPSDGIAFDDLAIEGRWAVVIASGYENISFHNVSARATRSDEGIFTLYDPRAVTVDGFLVSGGSAMLSATDSAQAQGVLFENGAYDSPQLCDDLSHFVPDPIGENVVAGTTSPTVPPTAPPTFPPATATTMPPATTTTVPTATTVPTITTPPPATATTASDTTTPPPATATTATPASGATTAATMLPPETTTTTMPGSTASSPAIPPSPPLLGGDKVIISQPVEGAVVSGRVAIEATIRGSTPPCKLGLSVDGRPLIDDHRPPFKAAWNTRSTASGSHHRITAVAYDESGRVMGESSVSVRVANFNLTESLETATWAGSLAPLFPDLSQGSLYGDAIAWLGEAGIVSGFEGGRFGAGLPTLRAQVAKMVCNSLGLADGDATDTPFVDLDRLDADLYPHRFVAALVGVGAVQGTSATTFSPWSAVSRAQMVTILVRALDALDAEALARPPSVYRTTIGEVSPSHDQSMRIAEYNGLLRNLDGLGNAWDPWAPATRGEVAQILRNVLSLDR